MTQLIADLFISLDGFALARMRLLTSDISGTTLRIGCENIWMSVRS
jgi:hypothetical protein